MTFNNFLVGTLTLISVAFIPESFVVAQIVPDRTLGSENSLVNQIDRQNDLLTGGAIRQNKLFHSFQEFNVNEGKGAFFYNPDGITNIFSRITGSNTSNILGKLGVLGNANLFLLNPNGFIFGVNSSLDLKGSFLATTATSLLFENFKFSADSFVTVPLLKIDTPIGLEFGQNSGSIVVKGLGSQIKGNFIDLILRPLDEAGLQPGLRIMPGSNLALIGTNIEIDAGVITAPGGKIEIASIFPKSQISFFPDTWNFAYAPESNLADILLKNLALVDASGITGGTINLTGNNVIFEEGAGLLIQSLQGEGQINIKANSLNLFPLSASNFNRLIEIDRDNLANSLFPFPGSYIRTLNALGQGSDINITADRIKVVDGSAIITTTFGLGKGGNLNIISKNFEVGGASVVLPRYLPSSVGSLGTNGNLGNLSISTETLQIEDGAIVFSLSFGSGRSGDISIEATKFLLMQRPRLDVDGQPISLNIIGSTSYANGEGGSVTINSPEIFLYPTSLIAAGTASNGKAGLLTINAERSITIKGDLSEISVGVRQLGNLSQEIFTLAGLEFGVEQGVANDLIINTSKLILKDEASIDAQHDGIGNGGNLFINADEITLENNSTLAASAAKGQGGNIIINSHELDLKNFAQITASAGGSGNGGNITLNIDTFTALDNSKIVANAFEGNGGNIQINGAGVFLSPNSFITASSEFGLDGTVKIETDDERVRNSLAVIERKLVFREVALADSCLTRTNQQASSFLNTGNEAIPINPYSGVDEGNFLSVPNSNSAESSSSSRTLALITSVPSWQEGMPLVRAQDLVTTEDGRNFLVAVPPEDVQNKIDSYLCR